MALYHPMDDANHCFFRMLLIARNLRSNADIEIFRLMDFYCLFPAALSEISLPRTLVKYKKVLKAIPEQFEPIPNKPALFENLRHVQNNALGCLVSLGFFDRTKFLEGVIALTDAPIPENLLTRILLSPIIEEKWFEFLTKEMPSTPAEGAGGWKARTNLSEFRYDTL